MRAIVWLLPLFCSVLLVAQDASSGASVETSVEVNVTVLEPVSVPVNLVNESWFTDRMGTAVIVFDELVEEPETLPAGQSGLSFIDVEVREDTDSKTDHSSAIIRFMVREAGIVTFPSLEFFGKTKRYQTIPQQISVGTAVRSEAMSLTLNPKKRQVYVGEPLRVDLTWQCDLDASRLQALNYYPDFFNDADVEIVIPRSTDPEEQQVGLPIGGRRVIAKRTVSEDNMKALGSVELPLYLRLSAPGVYTLPATRLECAYLDEGNRNFGQYAAHFNNSLFAREESDTRYKRLFIETAPIEIEVLPLPTKGRSLGFSGLFEPVRLEVSVAPEALQIGELMQAEVKVFSEAPHGMIDLPLLSQQRGLRGRFLVDDDLGRTWRADGTTFRCRLRALTTGVEAFPALQIQVFDPESGAYRMVTTEPVALSVAPSEGQNFIDLKSYKDAGVTLSKQSEGIWHNREANRMSDLMNNIVVCLASWFWLWLLLGLVGFLSALPVVRERRRRALDDQYRARAEAYAAFRKIAESDPAKWPAFLQFLAVSFGSEGDAWTVRDSKDALQGIHASEEDIESVVALHEAMDAEDYSASHPAAELGALNAVGKRILSLVGKAALLLLLLGMSGLPQQAEASDWSEAEQLFEEAVNALAGSDAAAALYAESALKFQAAAEAGERPGLAWYNAGNAWFQTGALGRSIAAYRQARIYRPFDSMLEDNLSAARALALTDVPMDKGAVWLWWPTTWLKALLLVLLVVFAATVLVYLRYRGRGNLLACLVALLLCVVACGLWGISEFAGGKYGVVVTESVLARKGPNYAYAPAFHEPLHDGVEFTVMEVRDDWGRVALTDGRECWLPMSLIQVIR